MQQAGISVSEMVESLAVSPKLRDAAVAAIRWQPPWRKLATIDGWVLWLGHPPIPDGLDLVPAPGHLIWDDPVAALGVAIVACLSYAARRGVRTTQLSDTLQREAPLAVVVPGDVHPTLHERLAEVEAIGVPVVYSPSSPANDLRQLKPFTARRKAHAVEVGRLHDPVLSFEEVAPGERIGNNSLSSFVLHPEGERDGVSITGEMSDRVGIEIGVQAPNFGVPASLEVEYAAARIPSFFEGVASSYEGLSLEIGWAHGFQPTAEQLGEAFRTWLKSLYSFPIVDVRIVFAPEHGRSARLVDMRERARQYAEYRTTVIAQADLGTGGDNPIDEQER